MLSDTHRPGTDDPIGALVNRCRFTDLRFSQAGLRHNLHPVGVIHGVKVGFNAVRFGIQERLIEQAAFACRNARAMRFQQGFNHAAHRGHIATQVRLIIGRADGTGFRGHNFQRLLRIGEPFQTAFAQRIKGHNFAP